MKHKNNINWIEIHTNICLNSVNNIICIHNLSKQLNKLFLVSIK